MQLKLTTRTKDGVLIVDCNGRIVFGEESSLLRDTVKKAVSENNRIVLNLGEVSYIDSGRLGTLVALTYTTQRRTRLIPSARRPSPVPSALMNRGL